MRPPGGGALTWGWGGGCLAKGGDLVESARTKEVVAPLLLPVPMAEVVVVSTTARRRRASMTDDGVNDQARNKELVVEAPDWTTDDWLPPTSKPSS